jgi:hypothetical protein
MAFPICINKHLSVEEAEESRDGKPIGVLGSHPPHVIADTEPISIGLVLVGMAVDYQ